MGRPLLGRKEHKIKLTEGEHKALRNICWKLACTFNSGKGPQPSISRMLQAIAEGYLVVTEAKNAK